MIPAAGVAGPSRRRRAAPYLAAALAFGLAAAAYLAGLFGLVNGEAILAQRETLRSLAAAYPLLAIPAFAAAYIGTMSLALPLGGVLGLLAGLLFGLWLGIGIVVVAGAISALAVFWAALSRTNVGAADSVEQIRLTPTAHGTDVVTVILADFRGLDTLVEITVLATAIIGVALLLRRGRAW